MLDARAALAAANTPIQAASLQRTAEYRPFYPPAARSKGVEGWVDLEFTISPEGIPQDLKVREAQPERVFDRAAIESVRRWRFEPVMRNGAPVEQRAQMRVRFELK